MHLLVDLYEVCRRCRYIDSACGYPDNYRFDKEILEKIQKFMENRGLDFLAEVAKTMRNSDLTNP